MTSRARHFAQRDEDVGRVERLPEGCALGDAGELARHVGHDAEGVALGERLASGEDDLRRLRARAVALDPREGLALQPRLAHARRSRHGHDDGGPIVGAALEGGDDLRELGLSSDEGRAPYDLLFAMERAPHHGASVSAKLELEPPARELCGRGVRQDLSLHRVARQRGRPVDHLAGGPGAVDARAPRGDAHARVEAGDALSEVEGARGLVADGLAHAEVADDRIPAELRGVGAARAQVGKQPCPRRPFGHVGGHDGRHEPAPPTLVHEAGRNGLVRPAALDGILAERFGDGPEHACDFGSRPRALGGSRREQARHGFVERSRDVRQHLGQPGRRGRHQARENGNGRGPDVRRATRDHFEEGRAEGVEVGPCVDLRVAARLLGRHVRGRSHDGPRAGQPGVLRGGNAEVHQLDLERVFPFTRAAADEDHVGRLDVAVHDAGGVRRGERVGHVARDAHAGLERHGRAPLALRDVLALEPLHRDVRLPVVELPEGHHPDDPAVAQPREHTTLPPEARLLARIDPRQRDDLERDVLSAHLVAGSVHDAHSAAADLALDDEPAGQRLRERCGHDSFLEPTAKISMLTALVPSGRMRRCAS